MNAPNEIWAWPSETAYGSDGLWLKTDPTANTRWAERYLLATPELLALIHAALHRQSDGELIIAADEYAIWKRP